MRPNTEAHQRGYTLIELAVVVTLMAMVGSVFMRNYIRADDFADHQRADMRNLVEQQRSLRTLEAVLQAIDIDTLSGFDSTGRAASIEFRRWIHVPASGIALGPVERIEWRAGGDAAGDVKSPGRVFLVSGTEDRLVADRVPAGGFGLRMDGRTLLVDLETYYTTGAESIARGSVRRAVFLGRRGD